MPTKIIIERDYIVEEELSEIDFDLNEELKIDYDKYDYDEIDTVSTEKDGCYWSGDSHAIKIDRVLKILNEFKNKHNCEYVEIVYHEDHIGYIFTGLNIHTHIKGSKGYKKYIAIDEDKIERQKQKKIEELENELKQLKV